MQSFYGALAAFALVLAGADAALALGWPTRPIRMVVPYTPGGYTDLMARLVGQKVSDALGQPIVFENKPGANAIIGTDAVAKAAPDGYTFWHRDCGACGKRHAQSEAALRHAQGLHIRLADEHGRWN